jgi:hypothetical protein
MQKVQIQSASSPQTPENSPAFHIMDSRRFYWWTSLDANESPYSVTTEWVFSSGPPKQPRDLSSAKARVLKSTLNRS